MGLKVYLPLAAITFLAATTGSDVVARTSITGEAFDVALRDHLYWAGVQFVGTILLFAPFFAVAFVCSRVEKRARSRSAALIFGLAMVTLLYFYFYGYQGAQHAVLEQKWTAAALSVGLLPFFVGFPTIFGVLVAGAVAAKFDRRTSD
ncbi:MULTISPECIES: hypothetical protein [unclassified Sphingomonas]|uniref:hypothetical protein n=1 Tax=unclassified Sphingomonas TaxID=196159 RepID=UPI000836FA66|nr:MULTISPECIES: hypothetical protein [unclassified Sphingomonas]